MALFQNSVLAKFQKSIDKQKLQTAFTEYKSFFHNTTRQDNIRESKEEQFQEGFLTELFGKILGYTLNPNPNYNLITENKNIKDSKKADGAILVRTSSREHAPLSVVAVIELKGTDTTDLGKVEAQAFGYKNNQPECVYVITSNFEKLRFYIDNAIEHIEFNLFTLSEAEFELLYTCMSYESISQNIPKKLKDDSLSEENKVTKQLYNDYSLFKKELHQNLVKLNPQFEPLELFKKSQKLLDRFLFLFFAEDRNLLPPNSVRIILDDWQKLQELDEHIPLYNRFKKYFEYLNTGFKGKKYDVFAYNGGLFKADEVLDNIVMDDALLFTHTKKLSEYDFESEVDVNILGHIFENSLNELDEVKAQLEGNEIDKSKTKRKKDGVFYTPKYITKYIVENTIGKLCIEKKEELKLIEADFVTTREHAPLQKKKKQELLSKLNDYRNWLLQLTICDPACGSGAFLNQALDFLISEHKYIDELQAKLFGDAMVLSDVEKSILENNLFGVDLNEESVEIAKLSLWLRTAQPNRKLNDLNNNIKCGNSLIDDPSIAGEKAFNWQTAFPQVFEKKEKTPYHITTAIHDSRTSDRMITYHVREKRANGTLPEPQVIPLTDEEEILITKTVTDIIKEDNLNVMAYNICRDHMHLLLVCEENERDRIVQKIKAKTARAVNILRGVTIPSSSITREHAPLSLSNKHTPLSISEEGNPLSVDTKEKTRGEKQNSLWTQKYGCNEIKDEQQLNNTVEYIRNNRIKHGLTDMQQGNMLPWLYQSYDHTFRTEYKGGFDVIIGNPPYGAKLNIETQKYLNSKYISGGSETAISFIKLSHETLLRDNGNFGFIIPKSFTFSSNYEPIRNYIFEEINEIVDCKKVWKEVLLEQIIFFFQKNKKISTYNCGKLNGSAIEIVGKIDKLNYKKFGFFLNDISDNELRIGLKMQNSNIFIKDIASNSRGGIFQNKITFDGDYEVLGGAEIQRTGVAGIKGKVDSEYIKNDSKSFIKENSVLVQNLVAHIENPVDHIKITACIAESNKYVIVDTINQITFNSNYDNKVFWLLFNSKLINWYCYRFIFARAIRTMHFDNSITNRIPLPKLLNQNSLIVFANNLLTLNKDLQELAQKFQRSIVRKFFANVESTREHAPLSLDGGSAIELPKKLQDWYLLSYAEFIKELGKKKIKLSLAQEAEWEEYFNQEAHKAQALKQQIDKTDKEIDQMVYALYELTEEEIKIVEGV